MGLAAFIGTSMLSRGFPSGATVNLIAWQLLPADARPSWLMWALAAAPATAVLTLGSMALILWRFRPEAGPLVGRGDLEAQLRALGWME